MTRAQELHIDPRDYKVHQPCTYCVHYRYYPAVGRPLCDFDRSVRIVQEEYLEHNLINGEFRSLVVICSKYKACFKVDIELNKLLKRIKSKHDENLQKKFNF